MPSQRSFFALALAASLSFISYPTHAQEGSAVIAEIGSRSITVDDLMDKEGSKLLQARYKFYIAERDALQDLIDTELLEMQAKKEGVTVDELLKRHVVVTVKEPTEDQLRFYFEGVKTDDTFDVARPKILETIHQLRLKKASDIYIAQLRGDYGVIVELDQPTGQVKAGDDPRVGPESAPVQIVEFADYECPYCQKVSPELNQLHEQFGSQVSFVYKDYPLPMHANAEHAAEAARCAGQQGKFWEFHDAIFESKKLEVSDLKEEARTLKLDADRFNKCLDSKEQVSVITKDVQEGQKLGITSTPSFFVNGHFMTGAIGYAKLKESVEKELAAVNTSKKQSAALLPASAPASK